MGIYDRDYYRREGANFLGSFSERGTVCKWLIGINVVVFVLQLLANDPHQRGDALTESLYLSVDKVLHGEVWRLLTYAFLHDTQDAGHILWNMLFLWWFGSELEDLYGPREFLAFYLAAALFGGLLHVAVCLAGWFPPHPLLGTWPPVLGASGAVTAVLTLCALHFPRKIILLFFVLPVPIWVIVLFQVGKDFVGFFGRMPTTVAVDVHLAGFIFAFAYYKLEWRLSTLWPDLRAWRRQHSRPKLRVYRGDDEGDETDSAPVAAPVSASALDDEQLDAKVDAILEKISHSGKESLTDHERQTLLRASERIKRRRT